jgi:O-succinylbenzoate synthase
MRIERAELRVIELPLKTPFTTSFGTQTARHAVLCSLYYDGLVGISEGTMEVEPSYREETLAGALHLLRDALLPAVIGADTATPAALIELFAPVRGNNFAKATVEMAMWDLWARTLDVPLRDLLGGVRDAVPVGVSLGIQSGLAETVDVVGRHVAAGYRRIKLKIRPGWDVEIVSAVREAFPDTHLTVDANSAYTLADAGHLSALDAFALDYIEQPLAYDDLVDHATLARRLRTPICLDESIMSAADARKALALGACGVVNVKAGRVGGFSASRAVHDVARAFGAPVWCGGMLETGVGRAANIHLATLPGFTMPGDTSSSSRYWVRDVVNEPLEAVDGMMPVPSGPGLGVTLDSAFVEEVTVSTEVVKGPA